MIGGGILTFDLGRLLGWAAANRPAIDLWPRGPFVSGRTPPRPAIECDTIVVAEPGTPHGCFFLAFDNAVYGLMERIRPRAVAYEAAIVAHKGGKDGKGEGIEAVRRLVGMSAVLDMRCADQGIQCFEIHNGTVKKKFAGNGRADKSAMVAACLARGWVPPDPNAADAAAVLECAVRTLKHKEQF